MKKLMSMLLSLVMAASFLAVVVFTASPASAVTCTKESSHDTVAFGEYRRAQASVWYDFCTSGAARWVDLKSARGQYWGYGQRNCGWEDAFDGFKFNFYMWSNDGTNYNPSTFKVPCESDGNNSRVIDLRSAPRLYVRDGSPRWKANATEVWGWGVPDDTKTLSGYLNNL